MHSFADVILVYMVLSNLVMLGSTRVSACITLVAGQGLLLGFLPLLTPGHALSSSSLVLFIASVLIKGILFPRMLFRAERTAGVSRESHPLIGQGVSILVGVLLLGLAMWMGSMLKLPAGVEVASPLVIPVSLFTLMNGLLLIICRSQALTQVLAYLVMENGIYIFGVSLARGQSLLVEMGVLLDVFVAVFVMGIAIFHISREFEHMDVDQLNVLRENN